MRKCQSLLSVSILVLIPLVGVNVGVLSHEECQTLVAVDKEGADCSLLTPSLAGQTCHELQDVLRSISHHTTTPNASGECVEVRVHPGVYVLTELTPIEHSLVLQGIGRNVTVKVSLNVSAVPQYVLSFLNAERARISRINFHTSPAIITFENVTNVIIEESSFRYFSQGAVDVFNCPTTVVRNCIFEHNGPVSVTKPQKYRGHAGGLSIAYYEERTLPGPYAHVSHCMFRNNSSDPLANLQSTSQLFKRFIFTGRGGGCAVNISPVYPLNATVEDCHFEENFARSFGGGLYVGFDGNSNHTVVVNRVKLVRNETPRAAGGLEIGFVQGAALYSVNSIFVYNSEFIENHSERGAGAYVFVPGPLRSDYQLSNFAHFENCTFTGNIAEEFGAAIGLVSPVLTFNRNNSESIRPFEIENCTFNANNGNDGGAVSTAHLPLSFSGSNTFRQNRGRTFVVVGALVKVSGGMHFVANDGLAINGGAMYLASLGQLFLSQGANFTFEGNKGVIGAAIIVDTNNVVPEVYSQLLFNPLCFLLYENASQSPEQWENVSFTFSGNKAIIASSVFMSDLALCSWIQFKSPSFDPTSVFRWRFVHFSDDNENTAHEPDAFNPEWYIQTPAQHINITANSISAYPGEPFRISIKAYDELGRPTAAVLRLSERDDITHYVFNPAVSTLNRIDESSISTSFYSLSSIGLGRSEEILIAALLGEESSRDTFDVVSAGCPPGYVLSDTLLQGNMYATCECDYQNPDIVDCNGRSIILRDGLWAVLNNRSTNRQLVSYSCPPQYCQCVLQYSGRVAVCKFTFNSQSPDQQCSCDREGELCGSCRNGYGVSVLLNKCVACPSVSGVLIAALIVADIVVFVGLLLLIKTFPTWLYPFLFYIQMLPYLTQHFPLTFEKVHSYAYYVSSGLSFYFIYDFCLYHGMSAPVSYLLRYLPLGVALGICSVVLVIRKVTKKPRDPGHGLWWIVLLMYPHVVHTSMSILNCPTLPGRSGDSVPRWYINGNIACFQSGHAPLGLLAILILAFSVFVIPLVLVYSAGWAQHPGWLRHTAEVMQKGFKDKYKWWATVELGRRALLLLFIVPFPENDYPAMFILSVIIVVFGFLQPYKNMYNNVLESLLSLDVFILLLLRNTGQISDGLQILPLSNFTANECTVIDGVTGFTGMLLPFYYASVVAFIVVIVIAATHSVRHYVLNRHSRLTVSEPQEDVGRIQRAVTTTELDIDSVKLLATAYTAFEDPEDQHTSSMDPDGGALVITLKPADH